MFGITKDKIAELPTVHFPGRPILINNVADAKNAIAYLSKQTSVGFDTETRPSFTKGHPHSVALLQLSTDEECFLVRLHHTGLYEDLKRFLEDESILKVGLSVKDDFTSLHRLGEFNPGGFLELQNFVKDYNIADNSLQKIYAVIFGERISKGQRLTNWEAPELTESQQAYAALDAWACLRIYKTLLNGEFNQDACPYSIDEQN